MNSETFRNGSNLKTQLASVVKISDYLTFVTLLEVIENFWRLSRTSQRLEMLSQNFKVTSVLLRNLAQNKKLRFEMTKVYGSKLLSFNIETSGILTSGTADYRHFTMCAFYRMLDFLTKFLSSYESPSIKPIYRRCVGCYIGF